MTENKKSARFMELEGLRAVAAIVVVLCHAALMFYPGFFYGVGSPMAPTQNMRLEDNIYQNPLAGLLSGSFAVGIFFVLSGFVLSVGFLQSGKKEIIEKLAAKRYLRLMLPAAASVLFACLLFSIKGRMYLDEVAAITHSGWLATVWNTQPGILGAIYQGVIGIFVSSGSSYDPVLWTIYYELIGSFVVFGTLLLAAKSRYRWVVYIALSIAFLDSRILGFVIGMIIADVYLNARGVISALNNRYAYIVALLGIIVAGYPAGQVTSPLYKFLQIPGTTSVQLRTFYTTFGAALLIVAILSLSRLARFFAHPLISRFGKYTYSLYLIHMPLLFTVAAGVFIHLVGKIGFHLAVLASMTISGSIIIGITWLFEKYIDSPAIRFSSLCAAVFVGERKASIQKVRSFIDNVKTIRYRTNPKLNDDPEIE